MRLEASWHGWLRTLFPRYFLSPDGEPIPFALYHDQFWAWLWNIRRGERPRPFVAIWPRGAGKSTSAELAAVALGARGVRRYGLYVCQTQSQADDHVGNIGKMLASAAVERYYPDLATRAVGKYGASEGWRRNRLRTAAGFTIDALGLDSAARGAKLDEQRPDLIVCDDLDDKLDSAQTTERKIKALTSSILPAGSPDLAVLAIQNLMHGDSIFARLADGRADFLADRIVSGPIPALENEAHELRNGRWILTNGEPTWPYMDLARCQKLIDTEGLTAFLEERQHRVGVPSGGMFDHLEFRHCSWSELPPLVRIVVWVDPAVTDTDQSDAHGIQADGIAADGTIYRLWSWERRTSPEDSLRRAILKAVELHAECVGVETDQGGDTWMATYAGVLRDLRLSGEIADGVRLPQFRQAKAGSGDGPKVHRASLMLADYERARIVHVLGTHDALEKSLRRFPRTRPFDLTDAAYWSWRDLRNAAYAGLVNVGLGTPAANAGHRPESPVAERLRLLAEERAKQARLREAQ